MEKRINLKDGFIKQNMVFMSGLLIAPVIACSTTLAKSMAVCLVFSIVSFATILICRLIPRTIVYTLRVIIYTATAAVFYIPAVLLAEAVFGEQLITSAGVYLPVIITNSLILTKTETRFYHESAGIMIKDVVVFILGFDAACLFTGIMREYLASGRIGGAEVPLLFEIPALETTFGGFLFIGINAGLFRALYNYRKKRAEKTESEADSLAEYAEDMGEFLVGKHRNEKDKNEKEKIKIYRTTIKKTKNINELLDMEFLSNRDVLEAFEAIIAEGQELTEENGKKDAASVNDAEPETEPGTAPAAVAAGESEKEGEDGSIS